MAGDKEGARRSAEAFEQTQAAREPINQKDMLNYYALAGNAGRIQQIYDRLEPLLREKEVALWRLAIAHRHVLVKNRELFDLIQREQRREVRDIERVDHAARLLTDTDEPIALIAEMSGFANRTSFNERFRERYKMTPSEYRRAAKA